jgi:protein SCO1
MDRRTFFGGAAATAFAPFALASSGKAQKLPQDGVEWFTDVEVTAQDGRTFRFFDDLPKGKIVLVNFFFTRCDALCPLVMENLAAVQDLLGPRVGKDIFMYSITLQPELDTPEVLAAYAKT